MIRKSFQPRPFNKSGSFGSSNYSSGSGGFRRDNDQRRNEFRGQRDFGPRRNNYIRAVKVLLIDADGVNQGIVDTEHARDLAWQQGLDLVEVSPEAQPPVCRIIDYSKYVYEQNKKKKKSRAAVKEMKEFRFSPVIEKHDIDVKTTRALGFLKKGHNVRLTVKMKGRQSIDLAYAVMTDLLTYFEDYNTIEGSPKFEGGKIFITFKADGKKRKDKQNSIEKDKAEQPQGESKAKSDGKQVTQASSSDEAI